MPSRNPFLSILLLSVTLGLAQPIHAASLAQSMDTFVASMTQLIRSDAAKSNGLAVGAKTATRLRDEINAMMAAAKAEGKSHTQVGRALTFKMMKSLGPDYPTWLITRKGTKDASSLFMGRNAGSLLEAAQESQKADLAVLAQEGARTEIPSSAPLSLSLFGPRLPRSSQVAPLPAR